MIEGKTQKELIIETHYRIGTLEQRVERNFKRVYTALDEIKNLVHNHQMDNSRFKAKILGFVAAISTMISALGAWAAIHFK